MLFFAYRHREDQLLLIFIYQQQRRTLGVEHTGGQVGGFAQHVGQVQRRGDRLAHFLQEVELRQAPLR